jgi:hypothetical protein
VNEGNIPDSAYRRIITLAAQHNISEQYVAEEVLPEVFHTFDLRRYLSDCQSFFSAEDSYVTKSVLLSNKILEDDVRFLLGKARQAGIAESQVRKWITSKKQLQIVSEAELLEPNKDFYLEMNQGFSSETIPLSELQTQKPRSGLILTIQNEGANGIGYRIAGTLKNIIPNDTERNALLATVSSLRTRRDGDEDQINTVIKGKIVRDGTALRIQRRAVINVKENSTLHSQLQRILKKDTPQIPLTVPIPDDNDTDNQPDGAINQQPHADPPINGAEPSMKPRKALGITIALVLLLGTVSLGVVFWKDIQSLALIEMRSNLEKEGEITLQNFFGALNNYENAKAYSFTNNEAWKPYGKFLDNAFWMENSDFSLDQINRELYTSPYRADVILNTRFSYIDKDGRREERIFDFHMKRNEGGLKIVRMMYPLPKSGTELPSNEEPRSPLETLKTFFDYLMTSNTKMAYALCANKEWMDFEEFHKEWTDRASLYVISIENLPEFDSTYGVEVFAVNFVTQQDPEPQLNCFHIDRVNGKYRLTRITTCEP